MSVWRRLPSLFRMAGVAWLVDGAPSMGAALAFYSVFSLAPLLLIVTSVAGLVFGVDAARQEILAQLTALVGAASTQVIAQQLQGMNFAQSGFGGTVVGILTLMIGATSVFAELQLALNRIWRVPPANPAPGLWSILQTRLLSLGLILGVGFLLIVSLLISAALSALSRWWSAYFSDAIVLANSFNFLLNFLFITGLFSMIYKWIPDVKLAWRDVLTGAALTSFLFTLGKTLIGLYIGHSMWISPFGAAASLVVLLLWIYYSAQIFLLGAEFTWVYARELGSLRVAS